MFGRKARRIAELETKLTEETELRELMSRRVATLEREVEKTHEHYERLLNEGRAGHDRRLKEILSAHERELDKVRAATERKLRETPAGSARELRTARAALEIVRPIIEAVRTAAPRLDELQADEGETSRQTRFPAAAAEETDGPVGEGGEPFGGRLDRDAALTPQGAPSESRL